MFEFSFSCLVTLPFLAAFVVSMIFAPGVISTLKRRKAGQVISEDGPQSHQSKSGTPTMGGLIILAGMLGGVFAALYGFQWFFAKSGVQRDILFQDVLAVVVLILLYAILGMVDDYLTIKPIKGVRGIASKPKAAAQILIAIAFVIWVATVRPENHPAELVAFGHTIFSGVVYWVFAVVFIAGMANFVNITDGLDGLVSGLAVSACAALVFGLIPGLPMMQSLSPMLACIPSALAGACLAFLWFNANPAKVFMGDTGSLAIGVALPAVAILAGKEMLVIVGGLVFILDGLSTALQWAVFKYTRIRTGTGRRVFLKSPIHHHFELSGWPEQSVVVRFWIVGVFCAVGAIAGTVWRLW